MELERPTTTSNEYNRSINFQIFLILDCKRSAEIELFVTRCTLNLVAKKLKMRRICQSLPAMFSFLTKTFPSDTRGARKAVGLSH